MKKLISSLFAIALVVSMTVLTSCGGSSVNVKGVIEKADKGETLTEADYGAVIDYVDGAMDDIIPMYTKVQDANGDMDKLVSLQKDAEKLQKKYSDLEAALAILDKASNEELGEANVEKAEKLLGKMMNAGISPYDF